MKSRSSFSFMKNIFNGRISEKLLYHFPFFETDKEGDYKEMANAIEEWMKHNADPIKFDKEKKLPESFLKGLGEMGLFGLIIPETLGGSEFTQTHFTRTLELLNKYDGSVALTVGAHTSIGLKGLYLYGNEKQKAQYMPKLASGEMIAAFALTEPGAGSDAAGIKTRAVKHGDHYILNGSKLWITNGGFADFFTVFAKEKVGNEDKITAFIVTRDMGGVTHGPEEQKLGIKASSTVEVFFKDVKIPAENILGKPGDGFKIAMGILNQGRIGLAGAGIGAMKSTLTDCIMYSKNRKTFGNAISQYGVIQNMLTEMSKKIYISESITYFTTNLVDSKDIDYSIEAAICKIYSTDAAWQTINLAMQMHGGNGYMTEYGIERRLRDSRIGLIFEGTNEILKLFVAMTGLRELAGQYQRLGKELKSFQNIKNLDSLNNAMDKIGFVSEFALSEVKKNILKKKLDGFHSALEKECAHLTAATRTLTRTSSRLILKYGTKLADEQQHLVRLADMAIDTFIISCVLSRINSVLEKKGGPEKNAHEYAMAKLIIKEAKARIEENRLHFKKNYDKEIRNQSEQLVQIEKYPFSLESRI